MNGQLNTHPLTELIHEISDARLSGALRLERGRVKAAVYFEGGQVVAALTNLRAFRLVQLLRRAGAVDASRLGEAAREGLSDEQAGVLLIRAGLLSPAELRRLQERQSSEVMRELLRWDDGEWTFDPRVRLAAGNRVFTDAPRLLVEAARELAPEAVARRLSDEAEEFAPATGTDELTSGGVQLLPVEAYVLSRVGGRMKLSEVVAVSGLPEEETRRAVYALALGGLLERERWPRALPADAFRQTTRAAAADANGVAESRTQTEAQEAQPTAPETEADSSSAIEELFAVAGGATHYEVLGVTRSSSPDEFKRAYYSLARRFHPDRFRRDADADLQQRIDAAFAKIAQAYETLKDSKLRAAYDLKLSKQGGAARAGSQTAGSQRDATSSDPAQDPVLLRDAEQKFQQGLAALERNDYAQARPLFAEAARLAPAQARYRAHFGRALARDKASRRQAESEYQAAITLDGANASYRVMLAELYVEVGLRRKAEAECERALALEPRNAPALRLLEELRRAS